MLKPILEIRDASITFGDDTLFSEFNLKLHAGELFSLTGESGRGKTSLLKAVLGFLPLSSGTILIDGTVVSPNTITQTRQYTSWIPQELAIPTEWVKEMVEIPFRLRANRNIKFNKETLLCYFEELGLSNELYDRRLIEISGGQRQRIMIAVTALLRRPLMLIDEPTSALDEESVGRVTSFLNRRKAEGVAILAVTHDSYFSAHSDQKYTLI